MAIPTIHTKPLNHVVSVEHLVFNWGKIFLWNICVFIIKLSLFTLLFKQILIQPISSSLRCMTIPFISNIFFRNLK